MSRKKRKYSVQERQAYWIGVGLSASRTNDRNALFDSKNPKIRNSILKGFRDDDSKNISKKFK